ncbi:TPA: hypothetical protein N0F65_000340 [Lagenidium giganteum]|uniref:Uncharacterized protein n=1 Tax=Lagenidium giganteum TaxID=4803 RepID=A0AAV2YGI7_9STRA|nr:TPA: hypothetical protein N0F65_000340 [Lagenidium giganteum]
MQDAGQDEIAGAARGVLGLPEELTASVTVNVEGKDVLCTKIDRKLKNDKDVTWSATVSILLRPNANAPQSKYEPIADDDEMFLFVYVERVATQTTIRRATEARVATAATMIDNFITQTNSTEEFGDVSRHYWAVTHARQPEGAPIVPPTSATFTQLQYIDRMQSEIDQNATTPSSDFMRIRCRINGDVVHLELSVEDVCRGLGLPAYSLAPPYRNPTTNIQPSIKMPDIDHEDQDDQDAASDIVKHYD